ncbi:hypothetical protein VNO78_35023 [Psophocarpus tetragonolobus]|uniref:procollagen-proline 4-dioxygenase n=1 Tax=Psophocarpus tetragonolobus TaxID=3891 RepID=A0AAN9NMR4_PSOTE
MVKPRRVWSGKPRRSWSWTLLTWLTTWSIFFLLILVALRIISVTNVNVNDKGKGKTSSVLSKPMRNSQIGDQRGERWVEIISWQPRAFLYHNFLTKEECEYLINIAKPKMSKSAVVDEKTGKGVKSRVRTSTGTFLGRGSDKIVRNIEKRIADFTFIPVEHGEGLQILHYEVGQKYDPHFDTFNDRFNIENGGQRIATMLMYISDVEEGGETVFPNAKGNFSSVPWWNELSDCGRKGLSIKPKMGDAVLFWSMKPDATLDLSSLHGSCPVIKGDKWSCVKWMHVYEYHT